MNGPQNYHEAERLLKLAARWEGEIVDITDSYDAINGARQAAQVHATLALAAATAAERRIESWDDDNEGRGSIKLPDEWDGVLS